MTHETIIPANAHVPTVVLGVTGCIAAYKAAELTRLLVRDGLCVKAVMTQAATRFIGPLTLRTLTGEPVVTSLWDDPGTAPVHHVSLAQEADVMLIAPCTANVLAKLAHGRADDMLTTTALATQAPLVIAPAMNTHMWRAQATRENLAVLRSRGAIIVKPGVGELACGDSGEGRLADLALVLDAVRTEMSRARDLEGIRVLVTAGPTREPIDAVRYLSNPSSGKTGYAIAAESARRGAIVTLVSGPTELADPFGVQVLKVTTAVEMDDSVRSVYAEADVVVATAAVSDFRPVAPVSGKLKKDDAPLTVQLERNPDILASLGADKGDRVLIGFAAETDDVVESAQRKLLVKHLDLVVANDVGDVTMGFGSNDNRVWFVSRDAVRELPVLSKGAIARHIGDEIARFVRARKSREG